MLVTGACGLIGSEVSSYFSERGWKVHGIDNNMRARFFGPEGDISWNRARLIDQLPTFSYHDVDIRDRSTIDQLIKSIRPSAIIHAAAQPSHDLAAKIPFDDFDINAVGTLNLLEAARQHSADAPFVFLSTNKVYGDRPNTLKLKEEETRYSYAEPEFKKGISENLSIDQSLHSLFGASKVAADILVQEYGRYFDMPTVCLRGGCLTGPAHSGVKLHGFLSFLIKSNLNETPYTIFGYKGKQVRDNIHALDIARFIELFVANPKKAAVYNIGGGLENSCSLMEAITKIESLSGKKMISDYSDNARIGDHICYYSDLSKAKEHYPSWNISKSLDTIFEEIFKSWANRTSNTD